MGYPVEVREQAVRLLQEGGFPVEVAASVGASAGAVRSWARAAGIKLSKSAGLRRAYRTGARNASRDGDRRRRYHMNEGYFRGALTPAGAWVLGLLYGDGCVCRRKGRVYGVELAGDLDVCEKVCAVLGADHRIRCLTGGCHAVRFHNVRFAQSLEVFGLGPAKTHDMRWPGSLPSGLRSHFVRGFWEADGCVSESTANGQRRVTLRATSASRLFMEELLRVVREVTGTRGNLQEAVRRPGGPPVYVVGVYGSQAVGLGRWLWGGVPSSIRGGRKYWRFVELRERHA